MPKKRKDCFLGIHFDFHAMPGEVVAHHFDPDVFCEMLDRVKPDFMQFDTKGHAGLSSYPTKAGTQAAEIRQDMLRFLREETEKREEMRKRISSFVFSQIGYSVSFLLMIQLKK